jgi:hypothetical protein
LASASIVYELPQQEAPLCQGEILTALIQLVPKSWISDLNGAVVFDPVTHPYAIVLSETCDLLQDYRGAAGSTDLMGQGLPNILFCQAETAEQLRGHSGGTDIWKRIRQNKDERYQFLEKIPSEADRVGEGLPELGVDFKRYFTIATPEVYIRLAQGTQRRSRLGIPYREHLAFRFAAYQCRVALPRDHFSE